MNVNESKRSVGEGRSNTRCCQVPWQYGLCLFEIGWLVVGQRITRITGLAADDEEDGEEDNKDEEDDGKEANDGEEDEHWQRGRCICLR